MSSAHFLIPVSAAVAALLPVGVQALPTPLLPNISLGPNPLSAENHQTTDPIIQTMQYLLGSEAHALLLRQADSGVLYAGHGSHASHGSHGSHGSHRSGY